MKNDSWPRSSQIAQLSRKRFLISSNVVPGLMVVLDSVVILSSALISYAVFVGYFVDTGYYPVAIAFVWLVTILLMNFAGLYEFDPIMLPLAFVDKIAIAFATTFLFLLAAAFSLKVSTEYSRIWIVSFAISACTTTIAFRLIASLILGHLADRHVFSRNMVIVGSGQQMEKLLENINKSQPRFISLLGVFSSNPQGVADSISRHPMLGTVDDLPSYIRSNDVDDVVISLPWSADDEITALMAKLRELPVNVYLGADLIGFRLPVRPAPDHFGKLPLVEVMGRPLAGWGGVQKAALDYGLGVILIILLLPLMILTVFAIRLESRGPAIFRQQRYGFVNRVFDIYKFRTMSHTAVPEKKIVQATRNDPRITQIGRLLRRLSLDELPQLFNVLNGTMSLVGPRPHAVEHNEQYARLIRGYFVRHRVKPGMTGWAQVNGFRGETKTLEDMEARVREDIYYVENWSLFLDLKILAMTLVICLTGRNAY
jgi:Undecaprenyl-phosphate glucose phosphotransferase